MATAPMARWRLSACSRAMKSKTAAPYQTPRAADEGLARMWIGVGLGCEGSLNDSSSASLTLGNGFRDGHRLVIGRSSRSLRLHVIRATATVFGRVYQRHLYQPVIWQMPFHFRANPSTVSGPFRSTNLSAAHDLSGGAQGGSGMAIVVLGSHGCRGLGLRLRHPTFGGH